ncbi:beta-N-acetylhexosaminidase [Microbaculum marinum]|uniref:beta-N-acetylhexosaminidase n=1 Tax=Microbaculum marinum TaxID=1764581 RepID=A0AAW9RWP2_9HYPH
MGAKAFISGCAGPSLTADERAFFADAGPWGLILFARNCVDAGQIRRLTDEFRSVVGRADAPVLIDQEGGRVQRLKPPHWPAYPPVGAIGDLFRRDPEAGLRAAWLSGRLIGEDLHALGITVDCIPCVDIRVPGASSVIGDRSYGSEPEVIAELARVTVVGLAAAGVAPILKHIPGHGRALSDSHFELPVVDTPVAELEDSDFEPFRRLRDLPMAMTAHVIYAAIDADAPATLSAPVIDGIIRGSIGFDGLVMTDDLSMKALDGTFEDRAARSFAAGCDMALHCNGSMREMVAVASRSPELAGAAARRAEAALVWAARAETDIADARREFADLMEAMTSAGEA